MANPDIERILGQALDLPEADRLELSLHLQASLNSSTGADNPESAFQRRMRRYTDHAWALASRSLTSHKFT